MTHHSPECLVAVTVLAPESFRGGCSFGTGLRRFSRDGGQLLCRITAHRQVKSTLSLQTIAPDGQVTQRSWIRIPNVDIWLSLRQNAPMTPYFFGYGSLVNRNTHAYPDGRPAQLQGWRRHWVRTERLGQVFLSVRPHATTTIDGLIAAVPGADWQALDARETGYNRIGSGTAVVHDIIPAPEMAHYSIPPESHRQQGDDTILLSYVDVVVQGFLREYGLDGVGRFFDTTEGWETPILNDRASPRYPRHQILTPQETALVDQHLDRVMAHIV
jgi:hypothetical protein